MKRILAATLTFIFAVVFSTLSFAAEHGGSTVGDTGSQEHGGKTQVQEHGGTAVKTPSQDDIRNTMKNYVIGKSQATGTFDIVDPETGKTRKLKLERVHERVGKTGDYYYSCADFKDTESGELLDLDLDVADNKGALNVADVRIHKVNGKERYTYDANDNRIPVPAAESATHEHGGKEHGGKEHGGN